jgi:hypothetical protein
VLAKYVAHFNAHRLTWMTCSAPTGAPNRS